MKAINLIVLSLLVVLTLQASSPTCESSLQGLKTGVEQLLHLKTWENKDLRDNAFTSILAVVVNVESQCKQCVPEILSMKSEVMAIFKDYESKEYLDLIKQAYGVYKTVSQTYSTCLAHGTMFVAVENCGTVLLSLKSTFKDLTHVKTWLNTDLRSAALGTVIGKVMQIEQYCKECSGDVMGIKGEITTFLSNLKAKDYIALIEDAVDVFKSLDTLYTTCVKQDTVFVATTDCATVILGMKSTFKSLTEISTWLNTDKRSELLGGILENVMQVEQYCKECGTDVMGIKTEVTAFLSNLKAKNYLALIEDAVQVVQDLDTLYTTCAQTTSFVATENCGTVLLSLKSTFKGLADIKTWLNTELRSEALGTVIGKVMQIEQYCKECGGDIMGMKGEITTFLSNLKAKDYMGLVEDAVKIYKSLDSFYSTCLKQSQVEFVATENCGTVIFGLKSTFKQLSDIKAWFNTELRSELLGSVLGTVMQLKQYCKVCGSDVMTIKSEVMTFMANLKAKEYVALVEDAVQIFKDADTLYTTCVKQTSLETLLVSSTCSSAFESIKTTLESLMHLSAWENSSLRDSSLSSLMQQVMQIKNVCGVCGEGVVQIKNDVEALYEDYESKSYIDALKQAVTAAKTVYDVYEQCTSA